MAFIDERRPQLEAQQISVASVVPALDAMRSARTVQSLYPTEPWSPISVSESNLQTPLVAFGEPAFRVHEQQSIRPFPVIARAAAWITAGTAIYLFLIAMIAILTNITSV